MPPLHGAPLALLTAWLPPNEQAERPRVQLATVDADGGPDLRTVLLSEWSAEGFVLHTDAGSRKAAQLLANPAAALLLLWPGSTRQLVVRGTAAPADPASIARGYAARSPYLQQLAWQNSAEAAEFDREARVAAWRRFTAEHQRATLPPPPTWTGYLITPGRLTFWESDPEGPSHRVEYRRTGGGGWTMHHLPG